MSHQLQFEPIRRAKNANDRKFAVSLDGCLRVRNGIVMKEKADAAVIEGCVVLSL